MLQVYYNTVCKSGHQSLLKSVTPFIYCCFTYSAECRFPKIQIKIKMCFIFFKSETRMTYLAFQKESELHLWKYNTFVVISRLFVNVAFVLTEYALYKNKTACIEIIKAENFCLKIHHHGQNYKDKGSAYENCTFISLVALLLLLVES